MLETVLERTKGKERTAFDGFFPTRRRYLCVCGSSRKRTVNSSDEERRGGVKVSVAAEWFSYCASVQARQECWASRPS